MEERDEWCFEFHVSASKPIRRAEADKLLDEAVEWAEAHRLGVGGGYEPASVEVDKAAQSWAFRFGLCATEDDQLIPRPLGGTANPAVVGGAARWPTTTA